MLPKITGSQKTENANTEVREMKRSFLPLLLLVLLVTVPGCDTSPTAIAPTLEHEGDPTFSPELIEQANKREPAQVRTFDDKLADLARSVPGFGGLFFENGQLVVYMKGERGRGTEADQARGAMQQALSRRFDEGELPRIAQARLASIVIREGRYGFDELQAWRVALGKTIFDAGYGVVSLGIKEDKNVIGIGISDLQRKQEVLAIAHNLGIPADAFRVDYREPITLELQSTRTDLRGGLQIQNSNSGSTCTLGPVVLLPDVFPGVQVKGFLTNSHCTKDWFALGSISDPIYQATVGSGNHIATELVDPPPTTSGCAMGTACVFADAVFLQWNSYSNTNHKLGTVYKTLYRGTSNGSTVVSGYFTITSDGFGYLGQEVNKVGRTTGWTYGDVTDTCEHWEHPGNVWALCQWEANYGSADGDSGSPVFTWSGTGTNISLVGMHWGSSGSTRIYSPIAMIRGHLNSNLIIK